MKQFFKMAFASALGFFITAIVIISLFIFVFAVAISQMESTTFKTKPNSVLHLKLEGEIVERSKENPFQQIFSDYKVGRLGLDDILSAIDKAEKDDNIRGIYLDFKIPIAGMATVEEIRNRLKEFKKSGKFVVAYADQYAQKDFYLATVADTILLNPVGMIDFRGIGGQPVFFKKALDKLGIEMQIFKVGTYKSAVEPFIQEKMSDANKAQVTEYISEIWNHLLKEISVSRKIPVEKLNAYANEGMLMQPAEKDIKYRLADKLIYRTDVWTYLKKLAHSDAKEEKGLVEISDMVKAESQESQYEDKVAIVYAAGGIDDGDSEGINSEKLSRDLMDVKGDSSVKAVVFRVNSPGGSAYGSEQIWHVIKEIQKVKPVVVSMGDYAASGGYYISCPASAIVAQPTTLTGSIGIFGMFPNVEKLTEKLGLTFDEVSTNRFATTPSINRPMRADEKALFQGYINEGYKLFVGRCAAGRKVKTEKIEAVAQGHVWTGEKAIQIGLVDKLGGIQTALELAAQKAKLKNYNVESFPKKKSFMEEIFSDMQDDASDVLAKFYFGENLKYYKVLQNLQKQQPMQARLPFYLDIE
ncbi:signal peptide peptidase SppA [Parabacteroides sp. FAFU027]|uniref:signal peptide peptidase SppA n=1 Tax=Parabacteroides sp. FAFU027 TaxID=2922715 RepID=UPI001FAF276A|nr:signal peptide peptidase SppA [Parabacteroides sp. FAFU027]